jgi:hypothetical protein
MIKANRMLVGGDTPGAASPVPAIAVVIVTYNSAAFIDRCLDSLAAGCRSVELVEVIISDNSAGDHTFARASRHKNNIPLRIVRWGRNAGYAAELRVVHLPQRAAQNALPANLIRFRLTGVGRQ